MSYSSPSRLTRIFGLIVLLLWLILPRSVNSAPTAIPRYDFAVTLDYPQHRLEAVQRVTVPNTFGESVSEIVFNVPAAHKPGVFTLQSVKVEDESAVYQLAGTILRVSLPRPLPPDESITLELEFVVSVPELLDPQSFAEANLSYTDDALMAGYWYPLLAPYRSGVGWLETPWYPIGDPFVSESADYTAIITATPGVTIVSGGALTRDQNVWRYDLPQARTFGFIASPFYRTLSLTAGEKTYAISVLPRHVSLAADCPANTHQGRASVYGAIRAVPVSYRCAWQNSAGRGAWSLPDLSCWVRRSLTITMARSETA